MGTLDRTKVTPVVKKKLRSAGKSMHKKENVPAFHHKGYEAKHNNGRRYVNNNINRKSMENMSIKIHE